MREKMLALILFMFVCLFFSLWGGGGGGNYFCGSSEKSQNR